MPSSKSGITQQPSMELLYVTPSQNSAPPSGIGALNTKNEKSRLWPIQGANRSPKVLQMLAALTALVLAVHWCILQKNNLASTNVLIRRLASGEKEYNQEERAGRAGIDACETLYTAAGSQEFGTSETSPAAQQVSRRMLNEEPERKRMKQSEDSNADRDSTTVRSVAAKANESAIYSMEGLKATPPPPRDTITDSSSPRSEKAADRKRRNSGSFATTSGFAVTKQESDDNSDLSNKHCIKRIALISTLRGKLSHSLQHRKTSAPAASNFTSAVRGPTRLLPIEPKGNGIPRAPIPQRQEPLKVAKAVCGQVCGKNSAGVSQLYDEQQGTSANQAPFVSRESMLKLSAPSTSKRRPERHCSSQRTKAKQAKLLPKPSPSLTGKTLPETASALEHQEPAYEKHPFYRLPIAGPAEEIEPFDTDFALTVAAPAAGAAAKLDPIRQLFLKPQLSGKDMQELVRHGEQLTAYAQKYLTKNISLKSNWRLSESMARRFLVADALWCVCNIVGPAMHREQWWNQILDKISGHEALVDHVNSLSSPYGPTFLARVVAALEQYKRGNRPSPREVVELKMRILRLPCVTDEFRRPSWDPWRSDDKQFRDIS